MDSHRHSEETKKRISNSLKGKKHGRKPLHAFTKEERSLGGRRKRGKIIEFYKEEKYDKVSYSYLKEVIFEEQDNECNLCGNSEWLGKPIKLQLHHNDGNKKNKHRDNLEMLCLNCHSFTDNFGFGGRKHTEENKKKSVTNKNRKRAIGLVG